MLDYFELVEMLTFIIHFAFISQDKEAMEYLKEVGPDTMIPCFSVNLKGNKSVEKCNEINLALFQDLAHTTSEHTAHRVPMIVTSSSLVPHKHSASVKHFKERLGVSGIIGRKHSLTPKGG